MRRKSRGRRISGKGRKSESRRRRNRRWRRSRRKRRTMTAMTRRRYRRCNSKYDMTPLLQEILSGESTSQSDFVCLKKIFPRFVKSHVYLYRMEKKTCLHVS